MKIEFEAIKITSNAFAIAELLVQAKGGKIRIMCICPSESILFGFQKYWTNIFKCVESATAKFSFSIIKID